MIIELTTSKKDERRAALSFLFLCALSPNEIRREKPALHFLYASRAASAEFGNKIFDARRAQSNAIRQSTVW